MVVVNAETIELVSKIINKKSDNIVKVYGEYLDNKKEQNIKFVITHKDGCTTEIIGKTIMGEYLNYNSIIPKDFNTTIKINSEEINDEISFMNKAGNKEQNDFIKLTSNENILKIECNITESIYDKEASRIATEKAEREADKEYYALLDKFKNQSGKKMKEPKRKNVKEVKVKIQKHINTIVAELGCDIIGSKVLPTAFNVKYVHDALKMYSNENVYIKLISNIAPCVITVDGDNLEMVLPVRIKD
jgi:DNA polymerase III sliding clamp (beta) subunit (PCNA family)